MAKKIISYIREILVAYGGWCAGGYLGAKITKDDAPSSRGAFWGMTAATMLSRFAESAPVKVVTTTPSTDEQPSTLKKDESLSESKEHVSHQKKLHVQAQENVSSFSFRR